MQILNLCPFKPGTIVGAGRWPNPLSSSCPPWKGVVLALNDEFAWENTIAFTRPFQERVDEHVKYCFSIGLLQEEVPVLWDFGDHHRVLWQKWVPAAGIYALRHYADDVRLWQHELSLNARKTA